MHLLSHYTKYGRDASYIEPLLALDDEMPEVGMFDEQCIGCECGPGWVPLVREAAIALRENGCTFGQIKNKFNRLRIYWDYPKRIEKALAEWRTANLSRPNSEREPLPYQEEMAAITAIISPLLSSLEDRSYRVCEECGIESPPSGDTRIHKAECSGTRSRGPR